MPFDDLLAFFDPTLDLPIGGKTYRIAPPDHRTGLALLSWQALHAEQATAADRERLRLDDDGERDFFRDCLGPVLDELEADGVSWPAIRHAGQTAYVWVVRDHCKGTEHAETYWTSPGKALATSSTPAGRASTRTAAGSGTRRRARGSGTSSPTTPPAS